MRARQCMPCRLCSGLEGYQQLRAFAHAFMSTAHGVRGCVLMRTAAGAVRAEEGGRRRANRTHSGVPSKDLQDPSFADLCAPTAARPKKGYLGITRAVEAALAGGTRTLCRVSPPGVGLAL